MFKASTAKPIISVQKIQSQIVANQVAVVANKVATTTTVQTKSLNAQKTELIQIMSDYIKQQATRTQTVDKLKVLSAKIA